MDELRTRAESPPRRPTDLDERDAPADDLAVSTPASTPAPLAPSAAVPLVAPAVGPDVRPDQRDISLLPRPRRSDGTFALLPRPSRADPFEPQPLRTTTPTTTPTPTPTWDSVVERSWTALRIRPLPTPPSGRIRARLHERRIAVEAERVRTWITRCDAEFVVLHDGTPPAPERVDDAVRTLDRRIHRGDAAVVPGEPERPDVLVADRADNAVLTRTWQQLAREGALTVTTGRPLRRRHTGSTVVVRTDAVTPRPEPERRSIRRPSWWAAFTVVIAFTLVQAARIVGGVGAPSAIEARWLDAVRTGSTIDLGGPSLPGSPLWPTLTAPILDVAGTDGLRWLSLLLSVITIAFASAASSRLFGRWAARTTAVALAAALLVSDLAVSTTPAPAAMAALALALLAVSLVEAHDRRGYILLAGLAAAVAVAVAYESIVFVGVLAAFFTLLQGRRGLHDTRNFLLVVGAGLLAWLLPDRFTTLWYALTVRRSADWAGVATTTTLVAAIAVALWFVVMFRVTNPLVRRRVRVLGAAVLCIPMAGLISTDADDRVGVMLALVLALPALAGAFAHRAALLRFGTEVVPARRRDHRTGVVDPSKGRVVGNMVRYPNRTIQLAAVALTLSAAWYLPWTMLNIAWVNWWLSVPFVIANVLLVGCALLASFNNAIRAVPVPISVARGHEPLVGVIVPTYGEPIDMVVATVRSIVDQDWPLGRLRVVVADDGHDDRLRREVTSLANQLPLGVLTYFRPPRHDDPSRHGDAKAGALNAALPLLDECEYIETRDADDQVGADDFLRVTIAPMLDDADTGFVQTIKEATTSDGDPFNNNEAFFYRNVMLARNAANAVFPCGSGLVWRRAALRDIGEFPVWNLVEDLHSGVLALRAGWRGVYVPVVGTRAQHAPEDVENFFRQRGTWALDNTRLVLYDRFRGLRLAQRSHFLEQGLYYLLSLPMILLILVPAIVLLTGRAPVEASAVEYAVHFWAYALSLELVMLALGRDLRPGNMVKSRLALVGMSPTYLKAVTLAAWYGPGRKPSYRVTRKTHDHQVYVRAVWPLWSMITFTATAIVVALRRDEFATELDFGSLYWAVIALVAMGMFLPLSWHGTDLGTRVRRRLRSPFRRHVQSAG